MQLWMVLDIWDNSVSVQRIKIISKIFPKLLNIKCRPFLLKLWKTVEIGIIPLRTCFILNRQKRPEKKFLPNRIHSQSFRLSTQRQKSSKTLGEISMIRGDALTLLGEHAMFAFFWLNSLRYTWYFQVLDVQTRSGLWKLEGLIISGWLQKTHRSNPSQKIQVIHCYVWSIALQEIWFMQ